MHWFFSAVVVLLALAAVAVPAAAQKRPIDLPWLRPDKGPPPSYPEVFLSPIEVAERDLVPVDARPGAAFEEGHLPGAVQLVLDDPCLTAEARCLRELLGSAGLRRDEGLVVYGEDAVAVGRLFWLLEAAGIRKVRVLDGGLDGWLRAGFRSETGSAKREPIPFPPGGSSGETVSPDAMVDRARVAKGFGTPGMEVVDVRGSAAWSSPEGHIPHSLPFDFVGLVSELTEGSSEWPEPVAARRLFARLGPRPTTYVDLSALFVLSGDGPEDPRPGLGYLLLRAMGLHVAVYPGGWADWRRSDPTEPALPVVRLVDAVELAATLEAADPARRNARVLVVTRLVTCIGRPPRRVSELVNAVRGQGCSELEGSSTSLIDAILFSLGDAGPKLYRNRSSDFADSTRPRCSSNHPARGAAGRSNSAT